MKKSKKPLTFTAGVLLTMIGMAGLSACNKADHNAGVKNTEIEAAATESIEKESTFEGTTEIPEEFEGTTEYVPDEYEGTMEYIPEKFDPEDNQNEDVYGPPPGNISPDD